MSERIRRRLLVGLLLVVLVVLPFLLGPALLQTGLLVFAAIIAAIGLTLLYGSTGQLSLGHAFFVALGAYAYGLYAGEPGSSSEVVALGFPPLLALVLAVATAGVAGLAFSAISSRLRGLSLGIASLSLVFVGQHLMFKLPALTGAGNGRSVTPFSLFGFTFADDRPYLAVAGLQVGGYQRLWLLGLVLVVGAAVVARNVLRGRPGRAFEAVRDGEVGASVAGVNVRRTKAAAFVLSSMYAGLGGVFLGLAVNQIVPDTFTLTLSISYLAAILIGGLGSVTGAIVGSTFVFAIPQLLNQYGGGLSAFTGGLEPGQIAQYLYGAAVILLLLFEPDGLAAVAARLRGRRAGRPPDHPDTPDRPTTPDRAAADAVPGVADARSLS